MSVNEYRYTKIMKFELETNNKNATKEDILADVFKIVKQNDLKKLTQENYKNLGGKYSIWMIYNRFSSWFNMLEEAGLERTRNLNITNVELFENLVNVWTTLGEQPKYNSMTKQISKYSAGTYEKRFGSWRKSLEAFVEWVNEGTLPELSQTTSQKITRRTSRNINWRLRAMVLMKDGAKCKLCGATPQDGNTKLHVDHIIPWAKGGETIFENLQILCDKCNIGKSDIEPNDISE